MKLLSFLFIVFGCLNTIYAQIRPENGRAESQAPAYVLKNATIYVSPDEVLSKGTIVIKGDQIIELGSGPLVKTPKDAVEIDCSGKVILPSFIDLYSEMGMPETEQPKDPIRQGAVHWNYSIHPEVNASQTYVFNQKEADELIAKGFGFAVTHADNGIAQGTGTLVALMDAPEARLNMSNPPSYYSFSRGKSPQDYPSSQMGSIALLRQAFYDAEWHKNSGEEQNLSYDALNEQKSQPMIFKTRDDLELLRAQKIANEFDLKFLYFGSGEEYQSIQSLQNLQSTIILPLDYPEAYDVTNPYVSRQIPLSDLKHWEMAPSNPRILLENGIEICFSAHGTKSEDFWKNLRITGAHGVTANDLLKALTVTPAKILGVSDDLGTLNKGKRASFVIYDADPLKYEATILETWTLGERTVKHVPNPTDEIVGDYTVSVAGNNFELNLKEQGGKLKGKITYTKLVEEVAKDTTVDAFVDYNDNNITVQFIVKNEAFDGSMSLRGKFNPRLGVFEGEGLLPNGDWEKWSAIRKKKGSNESKALEELPLADTTNYTWFPNLAYGFDTLPESRAIVITNATIWTNELDGIIENATLVLNHGKITFVGTGRAPIPSGAIQIDAKGKHVTSGIIDEHSHIAISKGVNEGGQSISAEVSIGDVVNPQDINIYRQLSGGVTAAQLLHGSANPIGGQSALIKLKWGANAEEMLIPDAPGFIKFALGENVKRSNWGGSDRFPQTRMGVEQVYYDGFQRAQVYQESWKTFNQGKKGNAPRVDLELEVLSEILREERFISCHSYVQSEINMLMHVADSMGFQVNTFTHILEGYKVADKMREHGVGGSTFSDWWAYKYEVNDAIPYNASLMHEQGVVVAINSDDAEMGRRLNQEAAKAVKYGGMSEEDAWKMVTLNPAKLLHLDDRMGSIKEGKDADIVIWSDNPLAITAVVEQTIIDGTILYDKERDAQLRLANQAEKARIISKMLEDNKAGGKKRPFIKLKKGHFHCDTMGEEATLEENTH